MVIHNNVIQYNVSQHIIWLCASNGRQCIECLLDVNLHIIFIIIIITIITIIIIIITIQSPTSENLQKAFANALHLGRLCRVADITQPFA